MPTKKQLLMQWKQQNFSERLLQAFEVVPRELFVPEQLQGYAYYDQPLPTMRGQSISQPSTIMLMLQVLDPQPGDTIFELGAGAGYQASLLSLLVGPQGKVVTADVIPELVQKARLSMKSLGIKNVKVVENDGGEGSPEDAPFDKIVITAACPTIPPLLIEQLKEGGIVLAPVGDLESQTLVKGIKQGQRLGLEFLGPFLFVPMKGKYGFKEAEMYYR